MGVLRSSLSRWLSVYPLASSVLFVAAFFHPLLAQDKPEPSAAPEPTNQQPAQVPSEQKKEDSTGGIASQAATATKNLGELALDKATEWESGWLTGAYVPKGKTRIPLTIQRRRELYLQQTLTTPGAYLKRMFAAGIDQARGVPSQWDDGWGGYTERFASREGQFITANSLAALGNAKLKYEPRYDRCECQGFWPRTRHAIVRNFITYNETDVEMRPQWALYGGAFGGGLISTSWKPRPRNALRNGAQAMLEQGAYGSLLNLFIEYAGEINRKIGAKKHTSPTD